MILLTQVLSGKESSIRGGTKLRSARWRERRAVRIGELERGARREKEQRQVRVRAQRVGWELTRLFWAWGRPRDQGMVGLDGEEWRDTRDCHRVCGQQHQQLQSEGNQHHSRTGPAGPPHPLTAFYKWCRTPLPTHIRAHHRCVTAPVWALVLRNCGPKTTKKVLLCQRLSSDFRKQTDFGVFFWFWLTTLFFPVSPFLKDNPPIFFFAKITVNKLYWWERRQPTRKPLGTDQFLPNSFTPNDRMRNLDGFCFLIEEHTGPTRSHPLLCSYAKQDQKHNVGGREKPT